MFFHNPLCKSLEYLDDKDASVLLTVEVFLLTVRLFYLRWGNRKQKKTKLNFRTGEP